MPFGRPKTPQQRKELSMQTRQAKRQTYQKANAPREPEKRMLNTTDAQGNKLTEDVTGMDQKAIEEKILINKEVEKARFNAKVKQAIEEDNKDPGTEQKLQELQAKQIERKKEALAGIPEEAPQMTSREKQTSAGISALNALKGSLPFIDKKENIDPYEEMQKLSLAQQIPFQIIGKATTTGIGEWRLSSLFDAKGSINDLQGDISADVSTSNQILRDSARGGNIYEGIETQKRIKEGINAKYLQTMRLIRESPTDIVKGMDVASEMQRDLLRVENNLGALERYAITKDKTELLELSQSMNIGEAQ